MSDKPPVRTFSMVHPEAGFIEFSIPLMSPAGVETYLDKKLAALDPGERFILTSKLVKQADEMWGSFALWIGDPVRAREELRNDKEISVWLQV